jgi:hypothetical protein
VADSADSADFDEKSKLIDKTPSLVYTSVIAVAVRFRSLLAYIIKLDLCHHDAFSGASISSQKTKTHCVLGTSISSQKTKMHCVLGVKNHFTEDKNALRFGGLG